jgi:hypothetical protein
MVVVHVVHRVVVVAGHVEKADDLTRKNLNNGEKSRQDALQKR